MESLTTRDGKPSAIEKVSLCEETVALRGEDVLSVHMSSRRGKRGR